MICSKCGTENPDGNWVCSSCGEPVRTGLQPAAPLEEPSRLPYSAPTPAPKPRKGGGVTILIVVVMLAAIVAVPAWYYLSHGSEGNSPTGTMEAYINAVDGKDCGKLYELTPNDKIPGPRSDAVDKCSQFMGILNFSLRDFEAIDEKIEGDTATVDFRLTLEIGGQSVTQETTAALIKEDGIWKVDSGIS